jgi:hypothetical protein
MRVPFPKIVLTPPAAYPRRARGVVMATVPSVESISCADVHGPGAREVGDFKMLSSIVANQYPAGLPVHLDADRELGDRPQNLFRDQHESVIRTAKD